MEIFIDKTGTLHLPSKPVEFFRDCFRREFNRRSALTAIRCADGTVVGFYQSYHGAKASSHYWDMTPAEVAEMEGHPPESVTGWKSAHEHRDLARFAGTKAA